MNNVNNPTIIFQSKIANGSHYIKPNQSIHLHKAIFLIDLLSQVTQINTAYQKLSYSSENFTLNQYF